MKQYPPIPRVEDAPESLLESGHLWLSEKVDGAQLRVQLCESGLLRFGDSTRVYEDPTEIPEPYRHAIRHIRERIDRETLRAAVDDVESVTLFGEATHQHTIEYDWNRLPPFLGFDVWSGERASFQPPDAVERIFKRLGLEPINVVEREYNTRDFDPGTYTIPKSAWYEGPAAGVVLRNKKGGRAKLLHPGFREQENPDPVEESVEAIVDTYATDRRFEAITTTLRERDEQVSVETVRERLVEEIVREQHGRLFQKGSATEMSELRSTVSARAQRFLNAADW